MNILYGAYRIVDYYFTQTSVEDSFGFKVGKNDNRGLARNVKVHDLCVEWTDG